MQSYHNNFYFKALIKTLKIHRRLNDICLRELITNFGKYDEDGFHLPHLLFSTRPFFNPFDLINTYCELIGHKYAQDVALYHLKKFKNGDRLEYGVKKYTIQQFEKLLNGDKLIIEDFINAIKQYQIKNWIYRTMHCNNFLDDKEFYNVIYPH